MGHRSKVVAATCAAVLLGLATVWGQGSSAPTPGPPASGATPKAFQRLVAPARAEIDPQLQSQLEAARRKLKDVESGSARRYICGMPTLPAKPALDPTFAVPPRDTATRFSMRIIPPRCQ